MGIKRIVTVFMCAILMTATLYMPALAEKAQLTPEKKAELQAKYKVMQEKWTTLTNEQKNEIYSLKDQVYDLKKQLMDKYLEFGIIDEATANAKKERIEKRKAEMRESGELPMGHRKAAKS